MKEQYSLQAIVEVKSEKPVSLTWGTTTINNGYFIPTQRHLFVNLKEDISNEYTKMNKLCTEKGWTKFKDINFKLTKETPHYCSDCSHITRMFSINVPDVENTECNVR